ncbi:MAG: DUF58 domain-containing protein [Desulfobacteraceae bacterium]|nr:DUF58 domain-containing protein [Desulfobacteraceae bacterium]
MKSDRTINRKNTYMLPTRYGLLFVVILTAMLAGSINYNNNLGFLLVFLLGGMAVISMLHTHRNMVGLKVLAISARPVFAGETAVFDLVVDSETVYRHALVFNLGKSGKTVEDTEPGTQTRIPVKTPALHRGILKAGPLKVSTSYPLGLFYSWSTITPELSCLVYPKPIFSRLRAEQNTGSEAEQEQGANSFHGVEDFTGLKTYQAGDPVRHISWKTYSRGQGLFTKEFAGYAGKTAIFDYDSTKGRDAETKLSHLCGQILSAAAANLEYGLRLGKTYIEPGRSHEHKHQCLKALALFGKNSGKNE